MGAERTFVLVDCRLWVSYPDDWSSDGSNYSVVSAISWRIRSHIEGPISSSTYAEAMFSYTAVRRRTEAWKTRRR